MRAQKRGGDACPNRALPANEIEGFVVGRIRAIGSDASLLSETMAKLRTQTQTELPSQDQVGQTLKSFAPMWDAMCAAERARSLALILERISYDGDGGTLAITFRPGGFGALLPSN